MATQTTDEVTADEFRERVENVYLELCPPEERAGEKVPWETPEAWGAIRWFARRAKVVPSTAERWVAGDRSIPGPALALLEELERQIED